MLSSPHEVEVGVGVAPHFFRTDVAVRLQVAEEDAEDALQVIEEAQRRSG